MSNSIETQGRQVKDIHKDLVAQLGSMIDEYFHVANTWSEQGGPGFNINARSEWPDNVKWIACYAVTGGSEGHYIHVDVIYTDQRRDMAFMGKTFQGMAHAQAIANRCAELLGA